MPRNGLPETSTFQIDDRQTFRYAEAARDYSPYTLDPSAAKALGLPGRYRAWHVHAGADRAIDRRESLQGRHAPAPSLGCRFSHPLYVKPEQELRARLWLAPGTVAFEAEDRDGNLVVKNGFAEVAS